MTPGKSGSSAEYDKMDEDAADKSKPAGAKEWAAELQGKSDEEKKQLIEETLKEANERVEARKNADTKLPTPIIDDA
eukprot:6762405-Karenia_brevis.AAC.1